MQLLQFSGPAKERRPLAFLDHWLLRGLTGSR
jgi:hypothetical protein